MDQFELLRNWLHAKYPRDVIMPVAAGTKQPIAAHKGDRWTWETLAALPEHPVAAGYDCGILLQDLCLVDFDDERVAVEFEVEFPELSEAPMETTRKGRHYLFERPKYADADGFFDGARQAGADVPVDFKAKCSTGTSGLAVVCPSRNKTWVRAPWDFPPKVISRSLLERVCKKKRHVNKGSAKSSMSQDLHDVIDPGRSISREDPVVKLLHLLSKTRWDDRSTWMRIAIALRNDHGDKYRVTWTTLSRLSPKFDPAEADRLWDSLRGTAEYTGSKFTMKHVEHWAAEDDPAGYAAYRACRLPAVVLREWQHGDRGLADIAHELLKDVVKRCNKELYCFDASLTAWVKKDHQALCTLVSRTLEEALLDLETNLRVKRRSTDDKAEAEKIDRDTDELRRIVTYVRKYTGMHNVTRIAEPSFEDQQFEQTLDSTPYLLGVVNGVVDLRTGELRERRPEDNVYAICPIAYDPTVSTDIFNDVVLSAMADDAEMTRYLQKLLGYAVTGEVSEEIFPVFTGSGRNCKGVVTQSLSHILGSLYRDMDVAIITDRRVSNIGSERAKLLGARVALFNELKPQEKLATHEVQLLSGGDGIPVNAKYKDPVTIQPRHMCLLCTNHMPELTEVIPAIVERMICIHFPVTFTDLGDEPPSKYRRQCDTGLKARLRENAPAVLKWFVDGAVAWYASKNLKRDAPAKVREFSQRYFREQDKLASFIAEHCEIGDGFRVATVDFVDAFNSAMGERWSSTKMGAKMQDKGFEKKKARVGSGSTQCFIGIQRVLVDLDPM